MDATHREFVDIVDAILSAQDAEVAPLLAKFAQHAEKHFDEEREWMQSTDFPAADCHIDEHEAVMASVRQVAEVVALGDVAEGRRLATELARWFPGHADYMDAPLAQWMAKRRMGGVPVVIRRGATGG
ncbi:MAG: hemerythrin domain-containing protein [Proteobacteria bacterium]|nr:hemerythrin domain-containing protein [Pseudomonadota bacterium]